MKEFQYDFGKLTVGDHFIIGDISYGTHADMDVVSTVIEVAREHFHGARWAYISNRQHSYSVNPLVHRLAPEIEENMVAFAVVTYRESTKRATETEKRYRDDTYDFIVCDSLTEAVERVKNRLEIFPCRQKN